MINQRTSQLTKKNNWTDILYNNNNNNDDNYNDDKTKQPSPTSEFSLDVRKSLNSDELIKEETKNNFKSIQIGIKIKLVQKHTMGVCACAYKVFVRTKKLSEALKKMEMFLGN